MRIISKDKDFLVSSDAKERIETLCKRYPKEKDGIIQYYQFCNDVFEELTTFTKKIEGG